ncbi:MAG TPA: hypothetical protein VFP94_05560, partial [Terriglobales bacterium]|nr:hypothetical protein [Terriglobales bacterium]
MPALLQPLRFAWTATRGHHLRPWRSPLVRWRIETYSGVPAEEVGLRVFLRFCWRERRGLTRFLLWTAAMRAHRNRGRHPGISAQAG